MLDIRAGSVGHKGKNGASKISGRQFGIIRPNNLNYFIIVNLFLSSFYKLNMIFLIASDSIKFSGFCLCKF